MFCKDACLGVSSGIDKIRDINDSLNADVVEQVNESQELAMISTFLKESNEYQYKKCLEDRISDVTSWRWVLEDLSKRLTESTDGLKYEQNALQVIIQRVKDEIHNHSREGTRPGAMCPLIDAVENAIIDELNFLKEQKKNFERLISELENQMLRTQKVKNRIEADIALKSQALQIEETCANKNYENAVVEELKTKKGFPMSRWVKRCAALKRSGLKALCNALTTRQQVRGARVQLSISAQAHGARIDAMLRRRLHTNIFKIQDLKWQREEALRDYTSLEQELLLAEKTLIEVMDQERIAEARFNDRAQRPSQELAKDDVNRKLRQEQTQLKTFGRQIRNNIKRISHLQNSLSDAISQIDCYVQDLTQVINLDEKRIRNREGEVPNENVTEMEKSSPSRSPDNNSLSVIKEEDEDDYPFDY